MRNLLSGRCGPVVVDGLLMQTHSGFDFSAAETKVTLFYSAADTSV